MAKVRCFFQPGYSLKFSIPFLEGGAGKPDINYICPPRESKPAGRPCSGRTCLPLHHDAPPPNKNETGVKVFSEVIIIIIVPLGLLIIKVTHYLFFLKFIEGFC